MLRQEIDSPVPLRDFTRRDFVQSAVGGGFAAAGVARFKANGVA
jgi:hypothetical protein